MQIAFVTFFLGLVAGAHPVAVAAGPEVAAVELRLDDGVASRLTARQASAADAPLVVAAAAMSNSADRREAGRLTRSSRRAAAQPKAL